MTELDFEELDKAVSDLMKDTGTEQADAPATSVNTGAPVMPLTTPAISPDATAPSQPTPTVVAAPAAAVVKPRGRFMDVKPTANTPQAPTASKAPMPATIVTPQAEEAPLDAPVEPVVTEEVPAEPEKVDSMNVGDYAADPAAVSEQSLPVGPIAMSESPSEEAPASNGFTMPDPIDVAAATEKKPDDELSSIMTPTLEAEQDKPAAPEAPASEGEQKVEAEPQPEQAMNSPFIPDAKVEKRPLGGAVAEASSDDTPADTAEQEQPEPAPLPRELSSDLMNLETDPNNAAAGTDKQDISVEPAKSESAEPKKAPEQPAAPVPQSNDAKAAGTIFDTAGYHNMPVTVPVKKKHGWMIIIWILVLLIVGACAGAAYFYFTTQ